jgi:hypothetical protein
MTSLPRVPVDLENADKEGNVRLNCYETIEFLEKNKIELEEGLSLTIFDEDLETDGVVVSPGTEGVWRIKIDWRSL